MSAREKRVRKRIAVYSELLATEQTYVDALRCLVDSFEGPLRQAQEVRQRAHVDRLKAKRQAKAKAKAKGGGRWSLLRQSLTTSTAAAMYGKEGGASDNHGGGDSGAGAGAGAGAAATGASMNVRVRMAGHRVRQREQDRRKTGICSKSSMAHGRNAAS